MFSLICIMLDHRIAFLDPFFHLDTLFKLIQILIKLLSDNFLILTIGNDKMRVNIRNWNLVIYLMAGLENYRLLNKLYRSTIYAQIIDWFYSLGFGVLKFANLETIKMNSPWLFFIYKMAWPDLHLRDQLIVMNLLFFLWFCL